MTPYITVYVNNNPKVYKEIVNETTNKTLKMNNVPYIYVKVKNVENKKHKVSVFSSIAMHYNNEIEATDNEFSLKVLLKEPVANLNHIKVYLNDIEHYVPVKQYKIHGKAVLFNDKPVVNPIIHLPEEDVTTVGDSDGSYSIQVCGTEKRLAIVDKGYSISNLEVWFYNLKAISDIELNANLCNMEVYNLHNWIGEQSHYIHFIPMSLERIKQALKLKFNNPQEQLAYKEMWPTLTKDDIKLSIDNSEVKILTFKEVPDVMAEIDGVVYTRPSYLLTIAKGHKGKILKVEIGSDFKSKQKLYQEKGEGYCILG